MKYQSKYWAKISLSLLLTLAMQPLLAGQAIVGKVIINGVVYGESSANIQTGNGIHGLSQRQIDTFNRIKIVGAMAVHYQRADDIGVVVSGDQNLLPLITTVVENDELRITASASYQPKLPLVVTVSSPHLNQLNQLGSGDVLLDALSEDVLQLHTNGSGNIQISGNTAQFVLHAQGSGGINARALTAEQATVDILGSGHIDLNVTTKLNAKIIGSGKINYFGHPEIKQQVLGSGKIQAGKS